MIASFPMYDRVETRAATDSLWAGIRTVLRAEGYDAPEELTRDIDMWSIWQSPDLLLAQTCGLPYRARLAPDVTLVGTPDYGLEDCPPGHYRSVIVATDDFTPEAGAAVRLAYNEGLSQSGWAAALDWLGDRNCRVSGLLRTGAHVASAAAVADGRADIAALDAVTWRLMQRYQPEFRNLSVVGWSSPTPGLPLITAKQRDPEPIARAFRQALAALPAPYRAELGINDLVLISSEAYTSLPIPPKPEAVAPSMGN